MTGSEVHEHVMEPLAGLSVALEVALARVEQMKRRAPDYEWQLQDAIDNMKLALDGIRETQIRAVEYWRNNGY